MARWLRLLLVIVSAGVTPASGQREAPALPHRLDLSYDGRFTFVRTRWQADGGSRWRGGWNVGSERLRFV